MKKLLFLIVALVFSASIDGTAHAQFSFKGQWGLSASGGYIPSHGFNVMVGGEKALKDLYSSFHMKFNFMQNQAKLNHPEIDHFNYQTYLFITDYSYSFAKFIPHPWYIQCTAGVNFGYENIPNSPVPTLVIENRSRFVYGLNAALQIELSAAKNFSLFVEPRFLYNFNSNIRKGFFMAGFGFKYYL